MRHRVSRMNRVVPASSAAAMNSRITTVLARALMSGPIESVALGAQFGLAAYRVVRHRTGSRGCDPPLVPAAILPPSGT
ncbi:MULTISPECIES: hypothetical protein [unclassified Streptomyces]|uniref:hypothetical protein n=1 Tax=unclassified Streptomyces TaxID=2593676 RepID=UPI0036299F58